jgi:glycosyltransferase involved in cell wall biosynthesis
VLLVDDGSTDQSQAIYEKLSKTYPFSFIRHSKGPLGYGRTILTLFRKARKEFDYLITFDADLQHAPMSIKEILECFENSTTDVVSTSRYLSYRFWDQNTKVPIDRYLTNMFITRTVNQCFNLILSDSFCGLKGYQAKQLPTNLDDAGYAFPLVYWHFASRKGLKIKEIETPIIYRSDRRARGEWKQRTKEYFEKLESLVLSSELKQLVKQNYENGSYEISETIDNQPNFPIKIYADFFNNY